MIKQWLVYLGTEDDYYVFSDDEGHIYKVIEGGDFIIHRDKLGTPISFTSIHRGSAAQVEWDFTNARLRGEILIEKKGVYE